MHWVKWALFAFHTNEFARKVLNMKLSLGRLDAMIETLGHLKGPSPRNDVDLEYLKLSPLDELLGRGNLSKQGVRYDELDKWEEWNELGTAMR